MQETVKNNLVIGTRGSKLALAQAEEVKAPKPRGRPVLSQETKLERELMKKEDKKQSRVILILKTLHLWLLID